MIALTHFAVAVAVADGTGDGAEGADGTDIDDFEVRAQAALEALSRCAGYRRGTVGRSTDDPNAWVLLTEWANVGSYRRALGSYDVKLHATPLLALAVDLPSAFEGLLDVAAGGETVTRSSDREPSA